MAAGQGGPSGGPVVKLVEVEWGREPDHVELLRKEEEEQNHAIFVKEREKKRKHVMTTSVLFGVNGLHGHSALLLVVRVNEHGQEHVMDPILEFPLRGK